VKKRLDLMFVVCRLEKSLCRERKFGGEKIRRMKKAGRKSLQGWADDDLGWRLRWRKREKEEEGEAMEVGRAGLLVLG